MRKNMQQHGSRDKYGKPWRLRGSAYIPVWNVSIGTNHAICPDLHVECDGGVINLLALPGPPVAFSPQFTADGTPAPAPAC
jgi:hypothetical protein